MELAGSGPRDARRRGRIAYEAPDADARSIAPARAPATPVRGPAQPTPQPSMRLRFADGHDRHERRLRAPLAVERDDAGAAGSIGSAVAGHGGRRRHRWRVRRDQRGRASSRGAGSRSRSSRRGRSAGAPRRATAGSSMPATSGARASSSGVTARRPGSALYRETLDGYETSSGSSPRSRSTATSVSAATSSSRTRRRTCASLAQERESLASMGVESTRRPARHDCARRSARDAYYGALVVPGSGLLHPGPLLRRARCRGRPGRRRPARGRPRTDDPAPGGRPVRRRDRAWRDPGPRRLRRHQRLHRRRRPDAPPADHPDRELHHRHRATARGPGAELSPQGPRVLRHQELPVLLARLGRPADGLRWPREHVLPTVDRAHRRDPPRRPARRPPAARRAADRLRVGRQRRLHLRPDAARRADEGRRRLRDGLLRDRASR